MKTILLLCLTEILLYLSVVEWKYLNQQKRFDVLALAEKYATEVARKHSFPIHHFDTPQIAIDLFHYDFHVIYETKKNVSPYHYLVLTFHNGYIVDQFESNTP